jgi:hypothetical protein
MRLRAIQFIGVWAIILLSNPMTYGVGFAGGAGTLEDPYQIATAEQLMSIGSDKSHSTEHFAVIADIDLSPALYPGRLDDPRGPLLSLSSGSLDGRGHEIRNFTGRGDHDKGCLIAFVGRDAVVRNLTLKYVLMNAGVAILVGENDGLVVNCSVEGAFQGTSGAFVGQNTGTIMHCRAVVRLAGAAGFAGINSGTISACCAIRAAFEGSDGIDSVPAGFVNSNLGVVEHCYATADALAGLATAGLVTSNTGTIRQCYASGEAERPLVYSGLFGKIESCYFLSALGSGTDNGFGFALTDAQMRRRESFVGWDFWGSPDDGSEDTWIMPRDGGYPALVAIEMPTSGGSGTAEDPCILESGDQLLALSRDPQSHYRLGADIDLQGRSFSSPIIPLFQGSFDGDGHTIANFLLTSGGNLGFFGVLDSQATVMDLNLQRVRIVDVAGPTGALAARHRGKVVGCTANVNISTGSGYALSYIGGLIGVSEGGEVRRCLIRCSITTNGDLYYSGGLVGDNTGIIAECHGLCFANGDFYSSAALAGRNSGTITDSCAEGFVNSHLLMRGSPSTYMGGLVGWNTGSITHCYASTSVASSSGSGGLVGGNLQGTIISCFFLSQVDGGGLDNGLGTSLTDGQMRQRGSFAGWDFVCETENGLNDTWVLPESDYPHLAWEFEEVPPCPADELEADVLKR